MTELSAIQFIKLLRANALREATLADIDDGTALFFTEANPKTFVKIA